MGAVLAAVAALALGVLIYTQTGDDGSKFPPPVTASAGITAEINGRVAGNPEATVQVVEWGDYQCPACTQFEQQVVPVLVEEYVNTGKITFEFRDFAFLGPESTRAAEAAACAQDQDKFWDFHSTIYANHNGENQGALSDDRLIAMAEKLELDMDLFTPCFEDGAHADAVADSYEEGSALGVNSTPTLMINGELYRYSGLDDLRAVLDAALAA
ncbi:MAG: DsbA family protein [Thermomicrobiales bacterium]|nr:DsbA family protein [Thermomicrobiales bacterium]